VLFNPEIYRGEERAAVTETLPALLARLQYFNNNYYYLKFDAQMKALSKVIFQTLEKD